MNWLCKGILKFYILPWKSISIYTCLTPFLVILIWMYYLELKRGETWKQHKQVSDIFYNFVCVMHYIFNCWSKLYKNNNDNIFAILHMLSCFLSHSKTLYYHLNTCIYQQVSICGMKIKLLYIPPEIVHVVIEIDTSLVHFLYQNF